MTGDRFFRASGVTCFLCLQKIKKLVPEGPQQEAGCSLEQRVVYPISSHLCSGALNCEKKVSAGSDGNDV